jgi:hypothetical protein
MVHTVIKPEMKLNYVHCNLNPIFNEDLLEEKKPSEKGCYSLIIHTYFLVVDY